ncbi:unnamed protein product [Heterobilharzia americana]|nr:unnamed protein product [Heterobilharzia americana]
MARCLNSYAEKAMHEEHYEEDVDDEDLDDDDVDGYEGLSEYDEDDVPGSSGYGSHSFGNNGGEGKGSDSRRQRSISEGGAMYNVETGEDNRRDHHNQLERLRGSKASRAVILQRAVECIEELVKLNRDHTVCVETLKRQNDILDSRVQELQRLVQRMDGEEACNTPTPSSSIATTICSPSNVALRLISSTASGVPMYRCMSQDALQSSASTECTGTASGTEYMSSSHVSVLQPQKPVLCTMSSYSPVLGRANTIMHFVSNTNTLSSVSALTTDSNTTSLVSSSNSAFSPSVSSDGSSTGPARSLSQRSSPGGLSSSSSSNTSSNPTSRQSFRIDDDYSAVSKEINITGSVESIQTSVDSAVWSNIKPVRLQSRSSSSPSRSSSPPSILSTVPTLLPSSHKSDSPTHSSSNSLNSGSCDLPRNKRDCNRGTYCYPPNCWSDELSIFLMHFTSVLCRIIRCLTSCQSSYLQ